MTAHQLDFVAPVSCRKCERLAAFIDSHRQHKPDWHNNPVPSFGPINAGVLVLGLAPGLRGQMQQAGLLQAILRERFCIRR